MIRRFTIHVVIISIIATSAWWTLRDFSGQASIIGAKWLHAVAGYPAPFLQADEHHEFWFAPMFPPLAGLVLASTWIPWTQRLMGLTIGLLGFWYVVSLQVAIAFSPYLTQSTVRAYLAEIQVGLNTIVFPVILWLIVTGGPPRDSASNHVDTDSRRRAGLPRAVFLALLFCAVCTLPVIPAAEQTNANLVVARNSLARALTSGNDPAALKAIDAMFRQQRSNDALTYLQGKLQRRDGKTPPPSTP